MTTDQLRNVILEAVDCLRQRKCRPDRESIAVYVMRKLGSSMNEIFSEIENVVDQGDLLKVEYKGSTSYRSPKSFDVKNSPLLTKHSKILNSSKTTRYVTSGINELLSTFPIYAQEGIPFEELKKKLVEFDKERFAEAGIKVIFEREEGAGNILVAQSGEPIERDPIKIFPKDIQVPETMKLISFCEDANPAAPERKRRKRAKKEEAVGTSGDKPKANDTSVTCSPDDKRLVFAVKSDPLKVSENGSSDNLAKSKAEQISSIGFKLIAEKAVTPRKSKAKGKNGPSVVPDSSTSDNANNIKAKPKYERKPCLTLLIHETEEEDISSPNEIVNGLEKTPSPASSKGKQLPGKKRKIVSTEVPEGVKSTSPAKGKKQKLSVQAKTENECDDLQFRVSHEPPRYTYACKRRGYCSSSDSRRAAIKEEIMEQDNTESSIFSANGGGAETCVYCRKEKNSIGDSEDFLSCGSCNDKIHPTCIDYSEEQAKRLRMNSKSNEPHLQWQCFSCKRCGVCQQALMSSKSCPESPKKNGDKTKTSKKKEGRYILCDRCDRGYHVKCINATLPTNESPWYCKECDNTASGNQSKTVNGAQKVKRTLKKQVAKGKKAGVPLPMQGEEVNPVLEMKEETVSDSSAEDSCTSTASSSISITKKKELPDISSWTPTQVQKFFSEKGLQDEAASLREQEIDGMSLLLLRRADIIFGLNLRLGPALKIYRLVSQLQQNSTALKKKISKGESSVSKRSDVSR